MADAGEANERLLTQLTFPDANHLPAGAAEGAVDAEVARAVAGEFFVPEGAIGLGLGRMTRTSVPEAAVDEEGEAGGAEDEVGADGKYFGVALPRWFEVGAAQQHGPTANLDVSSPAGDLVGA